MSNGRGADPPDWEEFKKKLEDTWEAAGKKGRPEVTKKIQKEE